MMMKQAIKNHINQERENFFRERKIKTLSLFFIDSIGSYRGENSDGTLRLTFQRLLKEALELEYKEYKNKTTNIEKEYASFIESSIKDISSTNGGYFAEDNSSSDEDIQKEVDQILKDKQGLISFKDEKGNWNTRRFIFSKWTLREGWDNPNVFQICKLRSSGSEINKLQEVGRGLRLPVDEYGNRIADEQFYLTYLYDYSEKDFAKSLIDEVNKDSSYVEMNIKSILPSIAKVRGESAKSLFAKLLEGDYIDLDGKINPENKDKLIEKYPEFNIGLNQNKIIDKNKKEQGVVHIRKEKFENIREFWTKINQKYYLSLDEISEDELYEVSLNILNKGISEEIYAKTIEQRMVSKEGIMELEESFRGYSSLNESIPYGDFLKLIRKNTGLPTKIIHRVLCEYNKKNKITDSFFNKKALSNFISSFQSWFEESFVKRFSYRPLNINSIETALTDINGNPKEKIVQGRVGIIKDDNTAVPKNFLYDRFIFDSPKEKENIKNGDIKEVIVFGKIPRKSVQVPLYFGGTTSPDFMYVIRKNTSDEINLVVETKDVEKESSLRNIERLRIESAKKFFEELKKEGINVRFDKQLKKDDIISMLNKMI